MADLRQELEQLRAERDEALKRAAAAEAKAAETRSNGFEAKMRPAKMRTIDPQTGKAAWVADPSREPVLEIRMDGHRPEAHTLAVWESYVLHAEDIAKAIDAAHKTNVRMGLEG